MGYNVGFPKRHIHITNCLHWENKLKKSHTNNLIAYLKVLEQKEESYPRVIDGNIPGLKSIKSIK